MNARAGITIVRFSSPLSSSPSLLLLSTTPTYTARREIIIISLTRQKLTRCQTKDTNRLGAAVANAVQMEGEGEDL